MCGVMALVAGVLTPGVAHAQMFSVGSARDRVGKPDVAFYSGVEWMEFRYQGPDPRDAAYPDYSFDAPLLRLQAEAGDLAIHAVFGRDMRGVNLSYTELGAELGSDYTVWRDRKAAVGFPIRLNTTYALVRSGESRTVAAEFNQSTVGVGTGFFAQARLGRSLRVRSEAYAGFGFVANGINSDGGTMRSARWSSRVHLDGLFSRVGIGAGVDVRTRSYALDIRSLEYRATSVAITGAITF
jgi:hypothetical protein